MFECGSEEEARNDGKKLIDSGYWPCYFFKSDTTGEKDVETFFTDKESLDLDRFNSLGVILNDHKVNSNHLDEFWLSIMALKKDKAWGKSDILELFNKLLPTFDHMETGKYLDNKM